VGATILALDGGDPELDSLAHEALAVPEATRPRAARPDSARPDSARLDVAFDEADWAGRAGLLTFDAAQHLVSAAAGMRNSATAPRGARSLRGRLARFLDAVSGTTT